MIEAGLEYAGELLLQAGQTAAQTVEAAVASKVSSAATEVVRKVERAVERADSLVSNKLKRNVRRAIGDKPQDITSYFMKVKKRNSMIDEVKELPSNFVNYEVRSFPMADGKKEPNDANFESFVKMRYSGRRKRRFKKRKLVTRSGVRRMIANYIPPVRAQYTQCSSGYIYGPFGQRGLNVLPVFVGGEWQNGAGTNFSADLREMRSLAITTAGGVTPATNNFAWKNCYKEFMFHNPVTYGEIVTVWLIKKLSADDNVDVNKDYPPTKVSTLPYPILSWPTGDYGSLTAVHGPMLDWFTEWNEVDFQTSKAMKFYEDFTDYPSKYPEWRRKWKIVKKTKFFMNPGETKIWKCKLPSGRFQDVDHSGFSISDSTRPVFFENLTHFFMFMVEGLPTHQNGGTNDPTQVNRCATGLEFTVETRCDVAITPSLKTDIKKTVDNYTEAVTAARSLISSAATVISSV